MNIATKAIKTTESNQHLWIKLISDPRLPQLESALNTTLVATALSEKLDPYLEPFCAALTHIEIERIQYRPGKRCRILYRAYFSDAVSGQKSWWFSAKLLRPEATLRHFKNFQQKYDQVPGWAPPILYLESLPIILWRFPYEESMDGLQFLERRDQLQSLSDQHLKPFLPGTKPWFWQNYQPLKYMPGKRCVLVHSFRNGADPHTVEFYSKTFPDNQARGIFQRWQLIYQRLSGKLQTPEPLCYWQEARTAWMAAWPGEPVLNSPDSLSSSFFTHLGEAIAEMHLHSADHLPEVSGFEELFQSAREDAAWLQWFLPQYEEIFEEIYHTIDRLRAQVDPSQIPSALIHNALRLEQFIWNKEQIALLDFDAAGIGDPLIDIAEFLSSLEYLAICDPSFAHLLAFKEPFLKAYLKNVPWSLDEKRLQYYLLISFLGKLHDSIKNLDRIALGQMESILKHIQNIITMVEGSDGT